MNLNVGHNVLIYNNIIRKSSILSLWTTQNSVKTSFKNLFYSNVQIFRLVGATLSKFYLSWPQNV